MLTGCGGINRSHGWAQAVTQALAYAPERVETLLADAQAGAPWRPALGLAEPSQQLTEAFYCLGRGLQATGSPGRAPSFDAVLNWCREERQGEEGLANLTRRVLRSALEQLRTRQATEDRGPTK